MSVTNKPLGDLLASFLEPHTTISALGTFNPPPETGLLSALGMLAPQNSFPAVASTPLSNTPPAVWHQWIAVRPRFTQFHQNLLLTPAQHADGLKKRAGVVGCLNSAYYGHNSETDNSFFVGSWGKDTAIRPPRDVDVFFLLPASVYQRFQQYGYGQNRQSALLQEIKNRLVVTYPATDMRGDGQVVMVNFGSYCVEVVPAFTLQTQGRYWICNTRDGGSYKETAPGSEVDYLEATDRVYARNLRPLIRMLKAWQAWCSVPIKSFHLELLAANFISESPWRYKDFFWFDWITRDFFEFLGRRANSVIVVPGTHEVMALGDAWHSRAVSAYQRAIKACDYERDNQVEAAGDEWQKIFGLDVPRSI